MDDSVNPVCNSLNVIMAYNNHNNNNSASSAKSVKECQSNLLLWPRVSGGTTSSLGAQHVTLRVALAGHRARWIDRLVNLGAQ